MNQRTIPGAALDGYIRLVRLPFDGAIALLPRDATGPGAAATIAVDRMDAAVRTVVGALTGDAVLSEDAARRRTAAGERARAMRLRTEAERTNHTADERLDERQEQAERERRQAKEREEARRGQARAGRERRADQAKRTEAERRGSTRKRAAVKAKTAQDRAAKARLETLETKSDALNEKDEAVTKADEARRLAQAAGRAKAARKR